MNLCLFFEGAGRGRYAALGVAKVRRLFDYSNLLQFCRNLVGDL